MFSGLDSPLLKDIKPSVVRQSHRFHRLNPDVYDLFFRFASRARASGRDRYGIATIAERVRWEKPIETKGDNFRLNNNLKSCYARLPILRHPEFRGFFELRRTPGSVDKDFDDFFKGDL